MFTIMVWSSLPAVDERTRDARGFCASAVYALWFFLCVYFTKTALRCVTSVSKKETDVCVCLAAFRSAHKSFRLPSAHTHVLLKCFGIKACAHRVHRRHYNIYTISVCVHYHTINCRRFGQR